jgi:hypothetical protein
VSDAPTTRRGGVEAHGFEGETGRRERRRRRVGDEGGVIAGRESGEERDR